MSDLASNTLEPRVSSLETEVKSLERSVQSLATTMRENNAQTSQQLAKIGDMIATGRNTPWGYIFTFLGLILAVITAIGALALNPIKEAVKDNELMRGSIIANSLDINSNTSLVDKYFSVLTEKDLGVFARLDKIETVLDAAAASRFTKEDYKILIVPRLDDISDKINEHQSDGHPKSILQLLEAEFESLRREIQTNNAQKE